MPGSMLGTAVRRVEDPELLTGRATFVDNLPIEGALHLVFVRSPFAHARVRSVDTSQAAGMPGVVAAYAAADLGLPRHHGFMILNEACMRPPLAEDKVRFVGDAVAVVVARTKAEGVDAAEAVEVDYEPLAAAVDPEEALLPDAPLQFEEIGTNLVAGTRDPDEPDPLAGAERVVRVRIVNQRVAVVPLEGNAIAVVPGDDPDGPELTMHVATQMPHMFRTLACRVLGLDAERVRVITPHVGGAFGGKAGIAHEHTVAIAVARKLGRPVKWVESRAENLLSMHGRGQVQYVEMGVTAAGDIIGLRCRIIGDSGAYAGFGGGLPLSMTRMMAQGTYRIPHVRYDVIVALTNTTPMGAFRGAGRPEAAAMIERIVDIAAAELGIDPVEMRMRNLIGRDEFPVTTSLGTTYDSGDYEATLRRAVEAAGYDELRREQAARRERGDQLQLGIGVSTYVEVTAGGGGEFGAVDIDADGGATIRVGTSGHGQGHATSFSMIVAETLGVPLEKVRFVQSDTDVVPRGGGTGGSRSLQMGGSAVLGATESVLEQARLLAAEELEASADDIVVTGEGTVAVAGVPSKALSWEDLANAAARRGDKLGAEFDFESKGATFPFGAHVSVVEVDTETGAVRIVRHVAVDDCGRIINPLIVAGQQHGGIAQGIAQSLFEGVVYDADGNPLTASLADYGMPSAAELPSFECSNTETPTPRNPLGAKGIGESGTIGSTPAVQNAIVDALSHLGVRHIDMPCSPERVWHAIRTAGTDEAPALWVEPPAAFATLPVRGAASRPEAEEEDVAI
ncbi:MAG TPA: xanthine dehydrogenase family protein molybdopterin-binding subunit [Acidimicrobiales bacterium]|nr:xanthine dehydrogenase family protein molybdopterin-binding subunit [Acidimicrobiales bacterium]